MPRRTRTRLIAQHKVRSPGGQFGSKRGAAIPVKVLRIAGAAFREWTRAVTA